ncbi:hypothetical protein [Sphingomonas lycopersici]|uniref:PH domain-containing protein n=1 Tax=Sphingomonas lycopersici TaxID=2951807 RepID=A0AA42CP54_9SPHN|nr:hypothetical protein [Sphingomonas lycopersici]MCW6534290.1 hypothetical protein [Sphingomonas lycopersici]
MSFWLLMWTWGAGSLFREIFTQFKFPLLLFLCIWAIAWISAAGTLLWMFAGSETITILGADIEVRHQALGFSRRWLYQGSQIRNLAVTAQPGQSSEAVSSMPFFEAARNGSITFDYGLRTISIASGLDGGEARMIIERMARKIPRSISEH